MTETTLVVLCLKDVVIVEGQSYCTDWAAVETKEKNCK